MTQVTVRPDLAKICHFSSLGQIFEVLFGIWQNFDPAVTTLFFTIGQVFVVVDAQ